MSEVLKDLAERVGEGPVLEQASRMAEALGSADGRVPAQRFVSVCAVNATASGTHRPTVGALEFLQSVLLQSIPSEEDEVTTAERWRAGALYRSLERRSLGSLEREAIEKALRDASLPAGFARAIPLSTGSPKEWQEPKAGDSISREDFETNCACVSVSQGSLGVPPASKA